MKMQTAEQITISNIPEISAIYFALLQSGYDYYTMERSQNHISYIQEYIGAENTTLFFAGVWKQHHFIYRQIARISETMMLYAIKL